MERLTTSPLTLSRREERKPSWLLAFETDRGQCKKHAFCMIPLMNSISPPVGRSLSTAAASGAVPSWVRWAVQRPKVLGVPDGRVRRRLLQDKRGHPITRQGAVYCTSPSQLQAGSRCVTRRWAKKLILVAWSL